METGGEAPLCCAWSSEGVSLHSQGDLGGASPPPAMKSMKESDARDVERLVLPGVL